MPHKVEPVVVQPVPVPVVVAAPEAAVKMDESVNDMKNLSEDDLIKLRKINFKKKVSGEKFQSFA